MARSPRPSSPTRYSEVRTILTRVLALNLVVASAKITFGYATASVSILSDGLHSLTDAASNLLATVGILAASRPPDVEHPYGHRKYETITAVGILIFLLLVLLQLIISAVRSLVTPTMPSVTAASFTVMGLTLLVNLFVVRYEGRAAEQLHSEVLFADAMQTRGDVATSLTVLAALAGVRLGYPMLDPIAALVVAAFIARSCFLIARETSRILSDRIVIAKEDLRDVVMSVPEVVGCHHIRTRGTADHVFLDLHVWFEGGLRLDRAHALSHEVKNRLMTRFPQIRDAVIHIEPSP